MSTIRKLTISILLLLVLVFCLCACSNVPKMVSVAVEVDHCTVENPFRQVELHSTVTFVLDFDEGYYYAGNNRGATFDEQTGELTLTNVSSNTIISVDSVSSAFTVTMLPVSGMTILSNPTISVFYGQSVTFQVQFEEGHDLVSCNVENYHYQDGYLTISNVTENLMVAVQTRQNVFPVNIVLPQGATSVNGVTSLDVAHGESAVFYLQIDQDHRYVGNDKNAVYDAQTGTLTLTNVTQQTVINVEVEQKTYVVEIAGNHFDVDQESKVVNSGESVSFEIELREGYTYVGNDKGATYSNGVLTVHQVRQNLTVQVDAEEISSQPELTVSIIVRDGLTTQNVLRQVEFGATATFTLEIDERYTYLGNSANAEFDASTGLLTLNNVESSQDIEIYLRQDVCQVTLAESDAYTISGERVKSCQTGDSVTFGVNVKNLYKYVGNNLGATYDKQAGTITVHNVTEDLNLSLILERLFVVTISDGNGYTVQGEKSFIVERGETVRFYLEIEENFVYANNNVGAVFNAQSGELVFSNVTGDVNIFVNVYDSRVQTFVYDFGYVTLQQDSISAKYSAVPNSDYVFAGWQSQTDDETWEIFAYQNNFSISKDAHGSYLTLRPIFVRPTQQFQQEGDVQTITIHANGGALYNSPDESITYTFERGIYLYSATLGEWFFKTFYRDGFAILEYNTQPDGTGEAISLGSRVLNDSQHVDLYAIWVEETPSSYFTIGDVMEGNNFVGYALSNYTGEHQMVVVPNQIDGVPVVKVEANTFVNRPMERLVVSYNLKTFEANAVVDCLQLSTFYLSDSLQYIYDESFVNCPNFSNLRMIAVLPPIYADHLLGSIVRRVEKLFYLQSHNTRQGTIFFLGGSGMFHSIDGETIDNALQNRYNIVNGGQNVNASGAFQLDFYSEFMDSNTIVYYAPEYQINIHTNELKMVSWLITESYYDAWRSIDIRNYTKVFSAFRGMQVGQPEFAFVGRYPMYIGGEKASYSDYNSTLNQYFTRNYTANNILMQSSALTVNLPLEEILSLVEVVNRVYTEDLHSKNIKMYYAYASLYDNGFTCSLMDLSAFSSNLANQLQMPMLGSLQEHLYPFEYLHDNPAHLTTNGARINSQKVANELLSVLN